VITKNALEDLYCRLNRREFVHPDPLEVLYDYPDPLDREVVGLVAASLAYGRVKGILNSVHAVLARMPAPRRFVTETPPEQIRAAFAGFKHRFATGDQLAALLIGAGRLIARHGSLGAAFAAACKPADETVIPALSAFVAELIDLSKTDATALAPERRRLSRSPGRPKGALGPDAPPTEPPKRGDSGGIGEHLLPRPERGSACKRLNLWLRWMVRRDAVDPGGWTGVSPAQLIVPLDVHMHRICRALGLTQRNAADLRTAVEITDAFRRFAPDDPVRYDFALTRLGIRPGPDADLAAFLAKSGTPRQP